ncbi:MAG: tetratricopeptide repeat protein [Anaerolineae bacterium]|nr:tetratricopeptide repeat protein [Anaerolineae bacterium]
MRRSLLFALVILGILVIRPAPTPQAQAQNNGTMWVDGCDTKIIDTLAATTDVIDYRAACDFYRECDPVGDGDPVCQIETFVRMVDQCPADDQQCHDGAILMSAAILAFDFPRGEWIDWVPPQTVIDGVPQALTAFWSGDDAAALAAYQLTAPDDFFFDAMLPLSRAVLYQRLGQPDEALAEYQTIFGWYFEQPLASYARSQLYADLGRLDEASFDVAELATISSDDAPLQNFVAAVTAQYPLDESKTQEWLVYSVNTSSEYVVVAVHDRSLTAPRPIRLAVYDDLDLILTIGLKNWRASDLDAAHELVQVLYRSDDPTTFTLIYPSYDDNYGSMTLTEIAPNVYQGFEEIGFFEGYSSWTFMLAPADAPDPRLALSDRRHCENGILSRLDIGSVVTGVDYSDRFPLLIADTPGGTVIGDIKVPYEGYITVIGGPECVGSVTWWEGIHSNGTRGWFAEHVEDMYYAQSVTMRPDTPFCAGQLPALSPRLTVGTSAIVLPDLGANNLRREPSVEAESVGAIPPDTTFEVIGGPVCVDDTVWWYADYEGVQGWTAEGQAPDYWVAPIVE